MIKEACLISKVIQRNENMSKTLNVKNDNLNYDKYQIYKYHLIN